MKIPPIMVIFGILLISGCSNSEPNHSDRRFPGNMRPYGNMSFEMSEEDISQVKDTFESAESTDDLSGYCDSNPMLCGYYCRSINPEHDFCGQFNLTNRRFSR